ncbi:MAG: hypothetical protein ACR2LX_17140 [Jatrophihabitans sp.]
MNRYRWRRRAEAVAGGAVGTAMMTLSLAVQSKLRPDVDGPIDYDASDHVVVAASKVVHWNPRSPAGRRVLFNVVHWGYGSVVALEYERFRRLLDNEPAAAAAFFVACQGMACTLFPVLGGTPPPWRWRRDVLLTSMGQHALYAAAVAVTSHEFRKRRG